MDHATSCRSCNIEPGPGTRWCPLCRGHLTEPALGRLAPPLKRLGAYVLDSFIPVGVGVFMLFFAFAGRVAAGGPSEPIGNTVAILISFGILIAYAILALVLFARGTTPGKHLLHMRVIKENGAAAGFLTMLGREWIGKWVSGMVFSLGYIWILIDREHQGWHDKLLATYVVEA